MWFCGFPQTRRLGKAMRGLALVVAALTFPVCSEAIAGEWIQDSVSSTTTGTLGTVAKLSGRVDDPHGARPAELVITCADNRTSVFVSADYLVFGGDAARVDYTIDNGATQRAYWNVRAAYDIHAHFRAADLRHLRGRGSPRSLEGCPPRVRLGSTVSSC